VTQRHQRDSLRRYLEGLALPQERNKTLTALANTEPVVGAQHPHAQVLQWFLSESTRWCGSMAYGWGSSKAICRRNRPWAGASTRFAPIWPYAAIGRWSAVPSPSLGTP